MECRAGVVIPKVLLCGWASGVQVIGSRREPDGHTQTDNIHTHTNSESKGNEGEVQPYHDHLRMARNIIFYLFI